MEANGSARQFETAYAIQNCSVGQFKPSGAIQGNSSPSVFFISVGAIQNSQGNSLVAGISFQPGQFKTTMRGSLVQSVELPIPLRYFKIVSRQKLQALRNTQEESKK